MSCSDQEWLCKYRIWFLIAKYRLYVAPTTGTTWKNPDATERQVSADLFIFNNQQYHILFWMCQIKLPAYNHQWNGWKSCPDSLEFNQKAILEILIWYFWKHKYTNIRCLRFSCSTTYGTPNKNTAFNLQEISPTKNCTP